MNGLTALLERMLGQVLLLAAPFVLAVGLAGLVVGVLQRLTGVRERGLAVSLRLAVGGLVLLALAPWMARTLVAWTREVLLLLPGRSW